MSLLIQHFLRRSARLFPDEIAVDVVGSGNDEQVTFKALAYRVDQICSRFLETGLPTGRHVAIFANNSIDYVACYFACAHLGIVLVPLNAHLQPAELEWILDDCNPVAIIADEEFVGRLSTLETLSGTSCLKFVTGQQQSLNPGWLTLRDNNESMFIAVNLSENSGMRAAMSPQAVATPDQLMVQMYTSGTTGTPKGVMLSHENITSTVMAWLHEMPLMSGKHRYMQATPLFHVGGMLVCMCCMAAGSTLTLLPRFEAQLALDTLIKKEISHTLLVPSMIHQLLLLPEINNYSFPHLETMVYGASCMPTTVMTQAIETFACDFLQGYGLTETSGVASCLRATDHKFQATESIPARLSAAGRELLCCELRVVDEHFNDVATGDVGEIVVRGSNVTKGYWNNEKATAESIINGWLKTGDLGRLDDDGYLYVVDRVKDMIDVSGENVYPIEIENVLTGHEQVKEAAVIGLPNVLLGEEVVAVVVANSGEPLTREAQRSLSQSLKLYANERLATYKCPVRYKYIEALPRTPAGKIQKNILREQYQQRA
ncbi:MAG: AMP-binding protein [Pseudomonadales bacterium]|nr:AMP-binding protein [Pseudomonadales bacterium]